MKLTPTDWDKRYVDGDAGWDLGYASTPLATYFNQLIDKNIRILLPGAGNAYEAEYMYNKGFVNIFVLDWSVEAINNFKKRMPGFPSSQLINDDFFEHKGQYDLIIEQTFFCAIEPALRVAYTEKMYGLLDKGGQLVGVLFDEALNKDKPPYGGNKKEYLSYFEPLFNVKEMASCYNSIEPRQGRELFINLEKK